MREGDGDAGASQAEDDGEGVKLLTHRSVPSSCCYGIPYRFYHTALLRLGNDGVDVSCFFHLSPPFQHTHLVSVSLLFCSLYV